MNKIITSFVTVVAVMSLSQVPLAAASDTFFGSGATNQAFGTSAGAATNGAFGAGTGTNDSFFGSGASNQPFGGAGSNNTGFSGSFGAGNQDSFFGSNATNRPFGSTGATNANPTSGSFSAGSGSGDVFFGSGAVSRPFGSSGVTNSNPSSGFGGYVNNVDPCDYFNDCGNYNNCDYGCSDDYASYNQPCDYGCSDSTYDEYQSADITNSNGNVNNNNNSNVNQVYINIYGNGSVGGSGFDKSQLPSCNDGLDNDNDGRVDFNDSDCLASGREDGQNASINQSAPTITSTPVSSVREGNTYVYDVDARDSDADTLSYSLLTSPVGMTIESISGVIRWTPTSNQSGIAHGVTVTVSDGSRQAVQSFQIAVERVTKAVAVASAAPARGKVAGASVVAVAEASDKNTLRAYNIRIDTDELGNSVVSWDTTRPSRGRVIYGRATQGDRPANADFTGAGQYEFSTPNTPETSTSHRIILGQLEAERPYYFRVVSFAGTDTNVSTERSFVQLGDGNTLTNNAGMASVIGTFGSFLLSPWFFFLVIIIIVLVIVLRRRGRGEIETHAPVEMHVGAHH